MNSKILIMATVLLALCAGFFPASEQAQAQEAETSRTLFVIGNINAPVSTYPLRVYTINGPELLFADELRPVERDAGAIDCAVDPTNEHVFVTYEELNPGIPGTVDVFDARDATPLGAITLTGTEDVAGIDVHVPNGHLYVVDRGETNVYVFDTATYASVDTWSLPSGSGAFGIDVVEDVDGADVIFIGDDTSTVRWYDLEAPHDELGSHQFGMPVRDVAVDNSQDQPIIFATCAVNPSPTDYSWLQKYDLATDTEDRVTTGGVARGVAVNPGDGLVYVAAGVQSLQPANVLVFDRETLTEQFRAPLNTCGAGGCNPTGITTTWLSFGSTVKKEIINASANPLNTNAGEFDAGEDIVFKVTIMNKYSIPIHLLPMKDMYDTTQLTYRSSTVAPADTNDDGEIDWTDLIAVIGHDMEFEEEYEFEVTFLAEPEDCERFVTGTNIAQMVGAENDEGEAVEDSAGSADYKIWCTCVTDEDCDDGIYCNGPETCENRQCIHGGNPCPVDDGDFCNGQETLECVEETQECGHTGDPCTDDGNMCNGDEVCDQDLQQCVNSGDPCEDDGVFCNGEEFCTPNKLECQHTGDPCAEDETCDEEADLCVGGDVPIPEDEEDAGWPERKVTGGCCGCE